MSLEPESPADGADGASRVLASAVVLPGASASASPSPPPASSPDARAGIKRRQSTTPPPDASHPSPKRQRLSPSSERTADHQTSPPLRSAGTARVDERKRSQRLFGALLGGTGQSRPASSAAAKRRAEQEERRRDDLRKREQELGERQKQRTERLGHARKIEQRRVDESNMRLRHQNLRAMANFLSTTTEPKIYYKPWELLPDQEDAINRQRDDVEALLDRELDEFDHLKERWRQDDNIPDQHHTTDTDSNGRMRNTENYTNNPPAAVPEEVSNTQAQSADASTIPAENERNRKDSIDDAGDIVVEADEDTVIY